MKSVPAKWTEIALVCRKCSKKLRGGFGPKGRDDLVDVLQAALKQEGRRRAVRFVEVGCLGLCPKDAVTVGLPGRMLAVPAGTGAASVLATILPPAKAATGTP